MNDAERRRDNRIADLNDTEILDLLCACDSDADVTVDEFVAFSSMRNAGRGHIFLTKRQRAWAEAVAKRIVPFDSRDVPRGREVPTPEVLRVLPKRPPRAR